VIRAGSKLPVGVDSFRCLVLQDYTFVDKSLLIPEFITASDKVSLILRPRRFGKSMNLDMLRYFFELVPVQTPDTCNRRDLFKGLLIDDHPGLFDTHFAKYPCIYLSMKDFKATSWPLMYQEIKNRISRLFRDHLYLLDSDEFDMCTKNEVQSIINSEDTYTQSSLKLLSQLLKKYHKSPCIVLIDEYDAPLESAYKFNNFDDRLENQYLEKANTFFGVLFAGLLKSNDINIYKALLVGVLRISKSGYLSDLNNMRVYAMFSNRYCYKFGFSEEEVHQLITQHPVSHGLSLIKEWYNSYSAGKGGQLYNPWSIISLCYHNELKPYWVETGSSSTIKELLWKAEVDFQNQVDLLLQGQSILVDIQHDVQYDLLKTNPVKSLWSLLYYAGYLTGSVDGSTCRVNIPNREVLSEWKGWFSDILCSSTNYPVSSLLQYLLNGDGKKFAEAFPSALQSSLTYFNVGGDNSGKRAESFYHAVCIGLFMHARDRACEVKSEGTAGSGRFDFSLYPPPNSDFHAVIMEFKIVKPGESMADLANQGLVQISTKNYRAGVPQHATRLLEVGISFKGNSSSVVFRKLLKVGYGWNEADE